MTSFRRMSPPHDLFHQKSGVKKPETPLNPVRWLIPANGVWRLLDSSIPDPTLAFAEVME